MVQNDICSEMMFIRKLKDFQSLALNIEKYQRKNNICKTDKEINETLTKDIFEEDIVKINNEENNEDSFLTFADNDNCQEDNPSSKIFNYSVFQTISEPISGENKKRKLGRKKKISLEKGSHDKYSSDNIIRKCKCFLINELLKLINLKIREIYSCDNNYSSKTKTLMIINRQQIISSTVKFNQAFLYKTLKEIFSVNISSRCYKHPVDHNRKLILELTDEKDKQKSKFFNDLFNLTFLDCIKHLRGDKNIYCLEGLKNIKEVCKGLKGDEDYKESFRAYIDNFENFINNKKSRKERKINRGQ